MNLNSLLRAHDHAGSDASSGPGRPYSGNGSKPGAFANAAHSDATGPVASAGLAGDSFIVALAHELRGPLGAIDSAAAVLAQLQADGAAAGSRMTSIIQRQVRQIGRLVDDLLDVGRLTHGKLRCEFTQVSLSDTLATAVEMHRASIDARQLTLELDIDGHWVKGDPQRLVQIFSNLLDNATKFSPDGGHIRVAARQTGSGRLAMSISDEGVGLDAAQMAKIFDPYEQIHPGNTDSLRRLGLGLGLSIVRGLVEQHGGTICVRSDGPGLGSELIFTLHACEPPPNCDE
jgi:signal transduction histidine kinase